jgi:hypothetical protein
MSISRAICAGLEERGPFQGGPLELVASQGVLEVRCRFSAAEKLGCALERVQVSSAAPARLAPVDLAARAGAWCDRIKYLSEPLRVVEIDAAAGAALMRSDAPRLRGSLLGYYELLADADGRADLRRYVYDRAINRRDVSPFVVTPEQLERLLDDLVAVAGEEH